MASDTPDLMVEMEAMRTEIARLRQRETEGTLLEQLVQKLDGGKGQDVSIDKPDKFDGKIGDTVENWLNSWELWFDHREIQDGEAGEKIKIDNAMQSTTEKVKLALARYKRDKGWTDWNDFKKYMKTKYMSTDSGFARYLKLRQVVQRDGETVESYYQRFEENIDRQREDDNDGTGNGHCKHINYFFVENLHPTIKPRFLRLPEAKDFQKRDLYELRTLASRVEESISPTATSTSTTTATNQ